MTELPAVDGPFYIEGPVLGHRCGVRNSLYIGELRGHEMPENGLTTAWQGATRMPTPDGTRRHKVAYAALEN